MSKTKLNPDEIRQMIATELRDHPCCAPLTGIIIVENSDDGTEGNWRVAAYSRSGIAMLPDCFQLALGIQMRIVKQYDAIWPRDQSA
jgi:hypothetical protein